MLEVYNIVDTDGHIIGDLRLEDGKYSANLFTTEYGYPAILFGFDPPEMHVGDDEVREYIADRALPPDRQGIEYTLKKNGLSDYDAWKILKLQSGRAADDSFHWVKIK